MNTVVPLQRDRRVQVADSRQRVRETSRLGCRERTDPGRQRSVEADAVTAEDSHHTDR